MQEIEVHAQGINGVRLDSNDYQEKLAVLDVALTPNRLDYLVFSLPAFIGTVLSFNF